MARSVGWDKFCVGRHNGCNTFDMAQRQGMIKAKKERGEAMQG